ncbi:MAG: aminotransferase class V-fold PLP-dependent enzyme [Acidimicrobiales bacterium]
MTAPPLPREQFPVADRFRYLDHAGIAAPPTVVAHAVAREAAAATMLGSTAAARRDDRIEGVRLTCAALMGVPTDDVTFVKSSADGLRLVAFGQPWARGDRVILSDSEHPATAHPWMALARVGVNVTAVPAVGDAWSLPLEAFEAALIEGAGRVRAVVVSWIHYARGWRTDLAALADLAHQHGAILVADVVQGLGIIPAQLADWGVDAALADGHNYLLGPEGVGLLYLSPTLRETLWTPTAEEPAPVPTLTPQPETDHRGDRRRFETASPNRLGIAGLGAAVELLAGAGIDAIWAFVDDWCDQLAEGLTALGATVVSDRTAEGRSAIVTATFDDADPAELTERLVTYGVIVSGRTDAVRFAPHGWNDADDLAATLHAVRRAWRR